MPVPNDPQVAFHRARLASAVRWGKSDIAEMARRDLDVILIENTIRNAVASLPLSQDERVRFALIALGETPKCTDDDARQLALAALALA